MSVYKNLQLLFVRAIMTETNPIKPKIAVLISMTSRNLKCETFDDLPYTKYFIPSFKDTMEPLLYDYTIFIGIDSTDEFLQGHKETLAQSFDKTQIFSFTGCDHKPCKVWNRLFERAYHQGFHYFIQIADDVCLQTPRWTTKFITQLQKNMHIGIVGPTEWSNKKAREMRKAPIVIENAFVHRTHYDIFQILFHPKIQNWFCDDWITRIYELPSPYGKKSIMDETVSCDNKIRDIRYNIAHPDPNDFESIVMQSRNRIVQYMQSHKLS